MSWITETAATTSLEAILGQRPELLERYRAFYKTFWEDGLVPRRTLEICRLRIAQIHECAQELAIRDAQVPLTATELAGLKRGDFSGFSSAEQAALSLAEQIPYQHHQITDEQMADAAAELTTPGAVSLLTALAFFDVGCRLRIVLDVSEEPRQLTQPPLDQGALA